MVYTKHTTIDFLNLGSYLYYQRCFWMVFVENIFAPMHFCMSMHNLCDVAYLFLSPPCSIVPCNKACYDPGSIPKILLAIVKGLEYDFSPHYCIKRDIQTQI